MTITTLPQPEQADPTVLKVNRSPSGMETKQHLSLRVSCGGGDRGASFIAHQYATYPFRLSGNLRLDPTDPHRVYAYIMNAGPGILAGDDLRLALQVGEGASIYLTDQSATKVHSRPQGGPKANQTWTMAVGANAYVEYVPEPVILFAAADFTQGMNITLHPQGRLVLGEIIVPGRLARGEFYEFERFQSRLRVETPDGLLCFADNQLLWGQSAGQSNRFRHSPFLAELPIMGNFVVVVPGVVLTQLTQVLQTYELSPGLRVGHSTLPGCNGILVRAIATQVSLIKQYQHHLLNCVRQLTGQPPLPDIPK
ncbi:urease accessory protein UreD [Leptothoe sp. PORK10 BA2]|uniref:urease accessory protein UreD n=1 Tax=Leptothoe sp. PORK10 BA2 TaxID=3110254 RepID=UPI002B1F21DF|nr:urease accessory protein UreD [Leptothoe sp. PORK10 BA2]MEA5463785.1 urease accessory protein UreD [Leptothoe sp. PORK10 BA2]